MNTQETIQDILEKEAQAIRNIPVGEHFNQAVALIVERVHKQGCKLVTTGMGKAGQIAMNIATTFCSTGIPSVFLHPSEAQHGDLGILQEGDVMLLVSNSGRTREILELLDLAERFRPHTPTIVITGNSESELAQRADVCLFTGGAPEVCPLGLTPTTSTTLMTVIGDILVVSTMKATGFDATQYALRHHGGYLGQRSREQSKGK